MVKREVEKDISTVQLPCPICDCCILYVKPCNKLKTQLIIVLLKVELWLNLFVSNVSNTVSIWTKFPFCLPLTYEMGVGGIYWSGQMVWWSVCLWNVMSQTFLTVFKSSVWDLLHMIPMTCRCAWHIYVRPDQRIPQLCPFFEILVPVYPNFVW